MILFRLNTESGPAIYQQLIDQIEAGITSGKLQAGEKMPSMRDLSLQLRINHLTVKQAYNALEASGLVETRRGLGSYITRVDDQQLISRKTEELRNKLQHAVEMARAIGLSEKAFKAMIDWKGEKK